MTSLIFGCGYLGGRVASRWRAAGREVFAVTRSATRADDFAKQGIVPIVADVTRAETLSSLPAADSVLFAVGHDRSSGVSQRDVYVQGLANVLSALSSKPRRFIYVSTTGVYGASGDDWVDEAAPCNPATPGGEAHLAAERLLFESDSASAAIILRLAGIYGPGRVPRRDDLIAGRSISAPRDGWLNLIHVDDAAEAVVAADLRATPPVIYNVSDGEPTTRREYLEEMVRLLGAPSPVFSDDAGAAPPVRGAASKRISNHRIVADLKVHFTYSNYREGLAAILANV